jgi:hypothetical protein
MTDSTNPYRPPAESSPASADDLTIGGGLKVVTTVALVFGFVGSMMGLTLGATMPSYYRTVFGAGDDPSFVPWQVGFGLGLTQGLISGGIAGGLVFLAVAWYKSRKRKL